MAEVKAGGETRKRESNMELLRIVSMLLIITFHCALKSGFAFEDHFSVNKFMVKTLWMFGELGVNLFLLISGYFMVQGKFKWRKLILLLAEVSFYQTLAHFVALKLGIFQGGGVKGCLSSLLSGYIKLVLVYDGVCDYLSFDALSQCFYICNEPGNL